MIILSAENFSLNLRLPSWKSNIDRNNVEPSDFSLTINQNARYLTFS
jgi:hypothetical protein